MRFAICLIGLMLAVTVRAGGDLKNKHHEPEFLAACREGCVKIVKKYLSKHDFDVNQPLKSGARKEPITGIYLACQEGHLEVVKLLLPRTPINVLNQRWMRGSTAFYMSAQQGHADVVEHLLTVKGIDITSCLHMDEHYGHDISPLEAARLRSHFKVVELLERALAERVVGIELQAAGATTAAQFANPFQVSGSPSADQYNGSGLRKRTQECGGDAPAQATNEVTGMSYRPLPGSETGGTKL